MLDALRSEFLKQTTLRSTAVYAVLLVGSLFGPVVLSSLLNHEYFAAEPQTWSSLYQTFFIFLAISVSFSASRTTSDIKNHMSAQAFLTQQGRWQSVVAKISVLSAFVAACFLVGTGLMALSVVVLGGELDAGNPAQVLGRLALVVTVSIAGVGFGTLVRNTVAAVTMPLVWLLVGEPLMSLAAEKISLIRPVQDVLLATNLDHLVSGEAVAGALAVFVGWIVVFGAAGLVSNQVRDAR